MATTFQTTTEEIKKNIEDFHNKLMQRRRYANDDSEGKWIDLTNAVQDYYYNVVGIGNNNLWKAINELSAEFLGAEMYC